MAARFMEEKDRSFNLASAKKHFTAAHKLFPRSMDPLRGLEKRRARKARRTARAEHKQVRAAERRATSLPVEGAPQEGLIVTRFTGERMSFLQRAIHVAYLKYRSHPTSLPIALLRTHESMERAGDDPALGWWPLARGRFSVEQVEGTHWTIFDPEHIARLAPQVDRALRQAVDAARGVPAAGFAQVGAAG